MILRPLRNCTNIEILVRDEPGIRALHFLFAACSLPVRRRSPTPRLRRTPAAFNSGEDSATLGALPLDDVKDRALVRGRDVADAKMAAWTGGLMQSRRALPWRGRRPMPNGRAATCEPLGGGTAHGFRDADAGRGFPPNCPLGQP